MKDKTKIGLAVGGLVAVMGGYGACLAIDSSHYVPEGHVGVIEGQFGFAEKPLSEGRHWFVGCDDVLCVLTGNYSRVHDVDVRWKHFDDTFHAPTSDGGLGLGVAMGIDVSVDYRINPERAASTFQQIDPKEVGPFLVHPYVGNAIRDILAEYKAMDFSSAEDIAKRKIEIEAELVDRLNQFGIAERYGVSVNPMVVNIEVPQALLDAFEEKRRLGGN